MNAQPSFFLPVAYGHCMCSCHTQPCTPHAIPCCGPQTERLIGECPACGLINRHSAFCPKNHI